MYCKVSDERLMQLIDENDGDDNKTLWRVLQSAFLQVTHIALKEDIQTFLQNKSVRFPNAVEYIIQHPISKKSMYLGTGTLGSNAYFCGFLRSPPEFGGVSGCNLYLRRFRVDSKNKKKSRKIRLVRPTRRTKFFFCVHIKRPPCRPVNSEISSHHCCPTQTSGLIPKDLPLDRQIVLQTKRFTKSCVKTVAGWPETVVHREPIWKVGQTKRTTVSTDTENFKTH